MEFVLENFDVNNYNGELLFYWLERNISFTYSIDKIKQYGNKGIIKLDYKLEGTYRLGHNLKNKKTMNYDDLEINIYSSDIIELRGGIKKRLDWIYFSIKEIKKNDIIIERYNKDKFRKEERNVKDRTLKMNIEYWNNYWKCLHLISFYYPDNPDNNKKMSIKKLLSKMEKDGLKCRNCTNHFRNYISNKNIEIIVANKNNLVNFFIDLHNNVNRMNGKIEYKKEEVYELYKDLEKISNEIEEEYGLNINNLLITNKINKFPDIYNTEGRILMKRKLGLFVLEK